MNPSNIPTDRAPDEMSAAAELAALKRQIELEREAGTMVADFYTNTLSRTVEPAETLEAGAKLTQQFLEGRGFADSDGEPWAWILETSFDLPNGWATLNADPEGAALARAEFEREPAPAVIAIPDAETIFAVPLPDISGEHPAIGVIAVPILPGGAPDRNSTAIVMTITTAIVMHMAHASRVRNAARSLQYAEAAARAQRRLVEPAERTTALQIAIDALETCSDLIGGEAVEFVDGEPRVVAQFGKLEVEEEDEENDQAPSRIVLPVTLDEVEEGAITIQSRNSFDSVEDETLGSIASAVTGAIARYRAAGTIESLRRSATRRLVEAQERERSMVAADIHDGVLQQLGATAIRLELAQSRVEQRDFDTASSIIADGANEIRFCARELRALLMELRPQVLDDNGLNAALAELGRHVEGVDVTVTSDVRDDLSSEFSITIFRIVQEALTNIQKHAHAKNASVDVTMQGGRISIDIRDDGIGYEGAVTGPSAEGSHLGLLGMRERARMFGGSFSIAGASGGGTEIHATLPLAGLVDIDLSG